MLLLTPKAFATPILEQVGQTQLSATSTSLKVEGIPSSEHLIIDIYIAGQEIGETPKMIFNSDTGANYGNAYSSNGGSAGWSSGNNFCTINAGTTGLQQYYRLSLLNLADVDKVSTGTGLVFSSATYETACYWDNSADLVDEVEIFTSTESSWLATGSTLTIFAIQEETLGGGGGESYDYTEVLSDMATSTLDLNENTYQFSQVVLWLTGFFIFFNAIGIFLWRR